ncbi:MAG: BtpA/SgcQ family protein [Acidimicrobiia bacterium]
MGRQSGEQRASDDQGPTPEGRGSGLVAAQPQVAVPSLIGMVHLPPLPGSPGFGGDLDAGIDRAIADAIRLRDAGFKALLIENFGDAPFFADRVPPITIAAMTRAVEAIIRSTQLLVGVNVLRNDAIASVAIAAATGAGLIRVNVLTGVMYTDQGPIVGQAAAVARDRSLLCPDVAILADIFVKHASPPPGLSIEQAAQDTWDRGGADALVVSGPGTGSPPDLDEVLRLRKAVPEATIVVGSGVTVENLAAVASIADGAIVGTSVKIDGQVNNPVDPDRAKDTVRAAIGAGWIV